MYRDKFKSQVKNETSTTQVLARKSTINIARVRREADKSEVWDNEDDDCCNVAGGPYGPLVSGDVAVQRRSANGGLSSILSGVIP